MNSPREDTTGEDTNTPPTPASGETLYLGLVSASVVVLAPTYAFTAWSGLSTPLAVVVIICMDLIVVFVVVPHLIALWLGNDVGALLGSYPPGADRP